MSIQHSRGIVNISTMIFLLIYLTLFTSVPKLRVGGFPKDFKKIFLLKHNMYPPMNTFNGVNSIDENKSKTAKYKIRLRLRIFLK